MSKHEKYSASKISRIIRCPGSEDFVQYLVKKKHLPEEDSTVYADEGTMLHGVMEATFWQKPIKQVLNAEQQECIEDCQAFLLELQERHNLTWLQTERRVSLNGYGLKDTGGTADIIAGQERRTLHILDWKFGQGVPVYVNKNEQLMTYLLGAAESFENLESYEELWIHLAQPRLKYFGSYQCSINELMGLVNCIKNAIKSHDIVAGEIQCFWCRGKKHCGEYHDFANSMAAVVFSNMDPAESVTNESNFSSLERLAKMIEIEPLINKAIKDAKEIIYSLPADELKSLGFKRVAGRSNRTWVSPEQVVEYLCTNYGDIEDIYETPKLKSPAKMEASIKGLKKDNAFQKLIHKPLGAVTIVKLDDPRPEYRLDPAEAFKHLVSNESED